MEERVSIESGSLGFVLNASSPTSILQIFDASPLFAEDLELAQVYKVGKHLQIELFDATVRLPFSLAKAPIPDLLPEATANDRFVKISENERKYPCLALEVFVDYSGRDGWIPRAEITLQNYGDKERPFPILQPYLTAINEVFLLGPSAKIGVQLKNRGYGLLKGNDRIILTLGWTKKVGLIPKDRGIVKATIPLAATVTDQRSRILWQRDGRRGYVVQNTGTEQCWLLPGDSGSNITAGNGILLEPGGIHSFGNSDAWLFTQPVWAVCDADKTTALRGFEAVG